MIGQPLQLLPEYREYVWGGARLRPEIVPTAEAWVVYEGDRVANGPFAGRILGELAAEYGGALLGSRAYNKTGARFPLLVKLLDCAQWLSLQVHPNDEQAVALEGPGNFGKTEAWHILDAADGATLIAGMKPGTTAQALEQAVRNGTISDLSQSVAVRAGDTVFMPAGTIHALGPGLLVYEVQQTSDWTYRVYDWGRPATPARPLHIEKTLAVARPDSAASALPLPALAEADAKNLCTCDYFALDILQSSGKAISLDTRGETFHAITVLEGAAQVHTAGGEVTLSRFETALIPADCGPYEVRAQVSFRALRTGVV